MMEILNVLFIAALLFGLYWTLFDMSKHQWNKQKRWVVEPALVMQKNEIRRHSNRRSKFYSGDFMTSTHQRLHLSMNRETYESLEVGYTGLLIHKHTGCHAFLKDACTQEELDAISGQG